MALSPAEQKKILKIEQAIAEQKKELEGLKQKAAEDFAKLAIKHNLWKLDKQVIQQAIIAIAEKHKLT